MPLLQHLIGKDQSEGELDVLRCAKSKGSPRYIGGDGFD